MPTDSTESAKASFFACDPSQFDALTAEWGWPRFRGQQVREWVYRKIQPNATRMTNLSQRDRETLAEKVIITSAETLKHQTSADGVEKILLGWRGDANAPFAVNAEAVMIPDADRRTACVSSQVGCPVGCKFCASGLNGVKGNLTAGQIVEQVFHLNRILDEKASDGRSHDNSSTRSAKPPRITNIVFMGMGEPLANYTNVMQAIRILHDPNCFNLGGRRITISTVGVPSKMRELAHEELPLNLAISLHAPNEPLRKQLIPWAEHFALPDILDAARYYFDQTGREITLEYILLSGVNDRPQHARELAKLCKTLRANVNLIRYNEVETLPFIRPKSDDVVKFQEILREAGVNAHVRKSRGRDIDAACGQLRRKQEAEQAKGLPVLNSAAS